jgi:hypothetical protein
MFGLEVFRQNMLIQIHGAGPAVEDVVTVQGPQLVAHVGAIDQVRLGAPGDGGGLLSSIRETAPLRVLFIPTLVPATDNTYNTRILSYLCPFVIINLQHTCWYLT